MRIRTIKPEFWHSEDISALDWDARLIFIGLWSYVDDNGVGRDVEKLILADLFPLEDDPRETLARLSAGLRTLEQRGQITRYQVAGKRYLFINAWDRHQKIDRPSKGGNYPRPTSADAQPEPEPTRETRETLAPVPGDQGNRGTGEPKTSSSGTPRQRGTRLDPDWTPPADVIAAIREECPDLDLRLHHRRFVDHWIAESGAKGAKLNWSATWRNWMRREHDRNRGRSAAARASTTDSRVQAAFDLAAELEAEGMLEAPVVRQLPRGAA